MPQDPLQLEASESTHHELDSELEPSTFSISFLLSTSTSQDQKDLHTNTYLQTSIRTEAGTPTQPASE